MPAHGDVQAGLVDDPGRRVGQRLRELRTERRLKMREVAERMVAAGHEQWTTDTVSAIETGRARKPSFLELLHMADIYQTAVDDILRPALGREALAKPPPPLPSGRRIGTPAATPGLGGRGQSERMNPYPLWPGQKDRYKALADRKGWTLADAARHCGEVGLRAYEREERN